MKRIIAIYYAKNYRHEISPILKKLKKEECIFRRTNEREFVSDLLNSELFIGFLSSHSISVICSMLDISVDIDDINKNINKIFLVDIDGSKNLLPTRIKDYIPIILLSDILILKNNLLDKILSTKPAICYIAMADSPVRIKRHPSLKEKAKEFQAKEDRNADTEETDSSLLDTELSKTDKVFQKIKELFNLKIFRKSCEDVEIPELSSELKNILKAERTLQCQTYEKEKWDSCSKSFIQPDIDYQIAVRIGIPKEGFLAADYVFPVETLEKEYPKEELPSGQKGWSLEIAFYICDTQDIPQIGNIFLPTELDSSSSVFSFKAPNDKTIFKARIIVLYKNRILQTARYEVPVCDGDEAFKLQSTRNTLIVESLLEPDFSDLDNKKGFDAALFLNHDNNGNPSMIAMKGKRIKRISIGNMKDQIDIIRNGISELTKIKQTPPLADAKTTKLLFTLAHQGRLMQKAIDKPNDEIILAKANRIQVTESYDGAITPVEFCYNRIAPEESAILCPEAISALKNGVCKKCPIENTRKERTRICPMGFWGLNRILERHRINRSNENDIGHISIGSEKKSKKISINPFLSILFGASNKANLDNPDITKNLLNKIQEVSINKEKTFQANTWKEWEDFIQSEEPTLLVLLVHTEESDPQSRTPAIEIGNQQFLRSSDIEDFYVRIKNKSTNKPMVLLIGCSTAVTSIVHHSFISQIQDCGASVILATLTDALGQHAGPLIEDFLVKLKEESSKKPVSFGEVLLRVRQKLLADDKLLSLSLISFGDADYLISQ